MEAPIGQGSIGKKVIVVENPKEKFKLIGDKEFPNPSKFNGQMLRLRCFGG